jgi:hypothetical protein
MSKRRYKSKRQDFITINDNQLKNWYRACRIAFIASRLKGHEDAARFHETLLKSIIKEMSIRGLKYEKD